MLRFIILLAAVAALTFSASAPAAQNKTTGTFEVEHGFVKAPECVKVGQRVPFTIRAKNVSDHPVKVTISPIGMNDNDWNPYAISAAKPSLLGKSLNAGSPEYPIIVHAVYWNTTLLPGQEMKFRITLLIRDYTMFPYLEGYPPVTPPWPPDFMYRIRVGGNLAKNQSGITTTPYCGMPLPPGYGDWYGGK